MLSKYVVNGGLQALLGSSLAESIMQKVQQIYEAKKGYKEVARGVMSKILDAKVNAKTCVVS